MDQKGNLYFGLVIINILTIISAFVIGRISKNTLLDSISIGLFLISLILTCFNLITFQVLLSKSNDKRRKDLNQVYPPKNF